MENSYATDTIWPGNGHPSLAGPRGAQRAHYDAAESRFSEQHTSGKWKNCDDSTSKMAMFVADAEAIGDDVSAAAGGKLVVI